MMPRFLCSASVCKSNRGLIKNEFLAKGHQYSSRSFFRAMLPAQTETRGRRSTQLPPSADYVVVMLRPVQRRRKHRVTAGDGERFAWQTKVRMKGGARRPLPPMETFYQRWMGFFGNARKIER